MRQLTCKELDAVAGAGEIDHLPLPNGRAGYVQPIPAPDWVRVLAGPRPGGVPTPGTPTPA